MPLYKGHLHGETMAEGLPKRLPKGPPMLQSILIYRHSKKETFATRQNPSDGESSGETFGETFRQGLPMTKPFAAGRFRYIMGRR